MTLRKITDLSGKLQGHQRILVCPLDWGLGHASRCVPIIATALDQGIEVEVASSGGALDLLKKRFPKLNYHVLPSYRVSYPTRFPVVNFLLILPGLFRAVWGEHRFLRKHLAKEKYDLLISDNRLGCYSRRVPCVYMTHQLQFAFRQKWMSNLAARMHAFWYRRFREIWVPDFPPPDNLSGKLSIPLSGDQPVYIGPLSQLSRISLTQETAHYDAAIILSGPEPQRTYLEREIIRQLEPLSGRFLLVRGLVDIPQEYPYGSSNVDIIDFAEQELLEEVFAYSKIIICRSGYSSIMDLYQFRKKALLIPTPGQPEQEYLARWHQDSDQFMVQEQGGLDLRSILDLGKG